MLTTNTYATNSNCDWRWVDGHLRYVCSTPRPTLSLSPSPTGTPYASPTERPTTNPTILPSDSSRPTTSPTVTPGVETSPEGTPRTDLSDGRSDGRTESLGCLRPEDGCGKVAAQSAQILPATGSDTLGWMLGIGTVGLVLGYLLIRLSKHLYNISKKDFESHARMFGSDDE